MWTGNLTQRRHGAKNRNREQKQKISHKGTKTLRNRKTNREVAKAAETGFKQILTRVRQ